MELQQIRILVLATVLMGMIPFVGGVEESLGIFKQSTDVLLTQVCSNCTYVNVSYVAYPNNSLVTDFTNTNMTESGVHYYLNFGSDYTKDFGRYVVCGFGDQDGYVKTWCYDFYINGTGRADPSGSVLTLFIILFLILCYGLVHVFISSLSHFILKNYNIVDLSFSLGLYFVIVGFYLLQSQYLGLPLMESILYSLLYIGGFTHVLSAFIFFFISLFRESTQLKNFESGIR